MLVKIGITEIVLELARDNRDSLSSIIVMFVCQFYEDIR